MCLGYCSAMLTENPSPEDMDSVLHAKAELEVPEGNRSERGEQVRAEAMVAATYWGGVQFNVDGVTYKDVGVQFRGNTSFQMARGKKKSLDLQFDLVDGKQSFRGLRNLDLLNNNTDPSQLRERFVEILREMRARYVLTYTPTAPDTPGWHALTVRLKNRKGRVASRAGYVVPGGAP